MKWKRRDAPPIVIPPRTNRRPTRWPPPEPPPRITLGQTRMPVGAPAPPPMWHVALSSDATEHELLAALRAAPGDAGTRMVYADWLEQHGALARAGFVRGNDDLGLRIAAGDTDATWRAITSQQTVRCKYPGCPTRWSGFKPTNDEHVRRCPHCDRTLRYCLDGGQAQRATERGEVVVLDVPNPGCS